MAKAATGNPLGWIPSQLALGSAGYAVERAISNPTGVLPTLQDAGAELQTGADAIRIWGIKPMGESPTGLNSDVPDMADGSPFPEPRIGDLEVSGQELVNGEYSIPVDSGAPGLVDQLLSAGVPVQNGGLVGQATQSLTSSQIEGPTPADDTTADGHARLIVGWRIAGFDTSSLPLFQEIDAIGVKGKKYRIILNSWGTSWCDGGYSFAADDWLLAQWNLFPIAVL
jgi:hypothetical protein